MVEKIVDILIDKGWHISTAESCTGGLVSSSLVEIAGISSVLDLSLVTYANWAKVKMLGVSEDSIKKYGVVSPEVASQMALGVAKLSNSEVAISTSGIAGPGGGTPNKPIGMVCFGLYINGDIKTYTKYFGDVGRNKVRILAKDFILEELYKELSGN